MLIIFGGLPGVGKSTISTALAKRIKAVYLRIDSIEQAIKNAAVFNNQSNTKVIAEGYMSAYAIADDNLKLGHTVITDSVNPIDITRQEYRKIAQSLDKPYFEVEVICSDQVQHQKRIETRDVSIANLKLPTWQEVLDRDYDEWKTKDMVIDTAIYSVEQAVDKILSLVNG